VHDAPLPHYNTELGSIIALFTLTPFIPLSLEGEGEDNKKEGPPPLLDALFATERIREPKENLK
jgi:hypothetical protein